MKKTAIVIGTCVVLMLSWISTPANASQAGSMQQRVDAVLEENPGGAQTAWNEVSWGDGDVVLTLAPLASDNAIVSLTAVAGCTSGRFCVYNQTGYRGDKITYSTCTSSHSVAALAGAVRSIANSRTSGTIRAYAGSTLLASAAAGAGTNVAGTTSSLSCT